MRPGVLASFLALVCGASCADQKSSSFVPGADAGDGADGGASLPDAGPTIVTGDPSKGILLDGTILGESGPFAGQVLVTPDGKIACASPGNACETDPNAIGVARANVAIVAPGLIDTHNHILFDIFDDSDWLPAKVYQNHTQWTAEAKYVQMVDVKQCLENASQGRPTWCPTKYAGAGSLKCEMDKWGELKGLVAGTTSIVGLAGSALPCFASIARSIDTLYNGLGTDKIQTSVIVPPSKTTADGVCSNVASNKTDAFLIHCGEGIDAKALGEFASLGTLTTTQQCLYAAETTITHGTAFGAAEFATMKQHAMKLTWSPASNVALYGQTADIPAALDAGLVVSLAPDWSMGGSQNLLDEMRFAKKWSDTKWGGRLTPKDIVAMTTVNAATAIGLADRIGTIKVGYMADLFVVRGDRSAPYDAILSATPKDVALTMVGGKALYGDPELRALAGAGAAACEEFDACGGPKFVCVSDPSKTTDKLGQTFAEIKAALDQGMTDVDAARPQDGIKFSPLAPVVACK